MDQTLKLSFKGSNARKRFIAPPATLSKAGQLSLAIICAFVFETLLTADAALQRLRGLPSSIDEL